MTDGSISAVGGLSRLGAAEHQDAVSNLKNGELSLSEVDGGDIEVDFRGDGASTARDVVSRFMQLNPGKDVEIASLEDGQLAASLAAELSIRQNPSNRHLLTAGIGADSPIPAGQHFNAKQSELKRALAPFKGKLDQLRTAVAALSSGSPISASQSKAIGRAYTPGIGLPLDPTI